MRYAFGPFELDTEAHELRRGRDLIKVQPKVFRLIAYLVEHRARYVGKEEMFRALWPDEHVTDSSLFVSVRAARIALGQGRGEHGPIAMLRGAGYRFVGEAREQPPAVPRALPQPTPPQPLIGRAAPMEQLAGAFALAASGRGQLVVLTGEAGIGKTRCAAELLALAEREGARVLRAGCFEDEGAPAFWPFVQLLRQCAAGSDASAARAREALERLVPSATGPADDAAPGQPARFADRFWLFDQIARALEPPDDQVRVLFVDDLQWADEGSLQLMQLLVSQVEGQPVLILAAQRASVPERDPGHARALRRLLRAARVVELTGLSEAETQQLVRTLAGDADAERLGAALHERTGGNPLFLRELLRAGAGTGGDPADPERPLPAVVRDVILARVEGLDADALRLLRAASSLGREPELAVLRAVSGLEGEPFLRALDVAGARGLLLPHGDAERCAFSHDLVREAIYAEIGRAERVSFHRRAGEALEARASGERWPVEIAYHFHKALEEGVREKALKYAVAGAAAALRALAFDTAARCYRWGLVALDDHAQDQPRLRAEILLGLGVAVLALGRSTEALRVLRSAAEIADRHGYADLLAETATWLRYNVTMAPLPDPFARHILERAQALLEGDESPLRVHVLARLSWIPPYSEDTPRCQALSEQALALARKLGKAAPLLEALGARLYALSGPDDVSALHATAEEIRTLERTRGRLSWATAQAHVMSYHACLQSSDPAGAERELTAFGDVAKSLRLLEPVLFHDRMRTQRALYAGKLAEAERALAEQHARGRRYGLAYADMYYAMQLAVLAWEREGLRELPPIPQGEGWEIGHTPAFRASRLSIAAAIGKTPEVLREWEALARDQLGALPRDLNYLLTLVLLSNVAIELSDLSRARVLYERLSPYAAFSTVSLLSQTVGAVAHALGRLARVLGDPEAAERHFEAALELHERMGYAMWAARTRVEHAELLLSLGGAERARRARALLPPARDLARDLGLQPLARRIEALDRS